MSVDSQESNQNLSILEATNEVLKATQEVEPNETQEVAEENTETQETEEQTETEQTELNAETSEVEEEAEAQEEPTDEVEEETEAEEPTFSVKVDGEVVEVTLDELKRGYSGEKTFHKRMNKVHQERQAVEQEAKNYRETRDQYAQGLAQVKQLLQRQEPNWNKLKSEMSPEQYATAVADYQVQQSNLKKIEEQEKQIQQEQQREATITWQNYVQGEAKLLLDKYPDWNKEKQNQVVEYARNLGFSDEEIGGAADHRMIQAIYEASRFAKIKEKTPEVKKKIKSAPKATKSGMPKTKKEIINNQRAKLRDNFRKDPTRKGAVELLLNQ